MCTAFSFTTDDNHTFLGRNMDIEFELQQNICIIQRDFKCDYKQSHHAIIANGSIINNYPLIFDGINEKGLSCAGLNFSQYAEYSNQILKDINNIPVYDFTFYILACFESVQDIISNFNSINIVDIPFMPNLPNTAMHWIIADSKQCIVVESTANGLKFHDNTVGVMTNSPTFDWHINNLQLYGNLTTKQPITNINQQPSSYVGAGAVGLPGDFSSPSRFVKTSFLKNNCFAINKNDGISAVFGILGNVAMIKGSVLTATEQDDITVYSACLSLSERAYYYRTYDGQTVRCVNLMHEQLDGTEFITYPVNNDMTIDMQN